MYDINTKIKTLSFFASSRIKCLLGIYFPILAISLICCSDVVAEDNVYFSGVLVNNACNIELNSLEQSIDFGNVPKKTFKNSNRATEKTFSIVLNDCNTQLANSVSMTFLGEPWPANKNLFSTSGNANGIGIGIETVKGTPVYPNKSIENLILNSGYNVISFVAYLQAEEYQSIKDGDFYSIVNFSIEYE